MYVRDLTVEEQRSHPAYGVRGWLLLILVWHSLGLLPIPLFFLADEHSLRSFGFSSELTALDIAFGSVTTAITVSFLVLGFSKSRLFPFVFAWTSLASFIFFDVPGFLFGLLNRLDLDGEFPGTSDDYLFLIQNILVYVVVSILIIIYAFTSRRIRVTYLAQDFALGFPGAKE